MAIEKMSIMNIFGPNEDLHDVLKTVVLSKNVHIKNYTKDKIQDSLSMSVLSAYNSDIRHMDDFKRYKSEKINFKYYEEKLDQIASLLEIDLKVTDNLDADYSFDKVAARIEEIYSKIDPLGEGKEKAKKEISEKEDFLESIANLDGMKVDFSHIGDMEYFNYHIGTLNKERRIKLRDNYENIPAIILHIGTGATGESYLVFSSKENDEETIKILKSLNFKEIEFPEGMSGTLSEIETKVKDSIAKLKKQINKNADVIKEIRNEYQGEIIKLKSELQLEKTIHDLMNNVAETENFFYFAGWVSEENWDSLTDTLQKQHKRILIKGLNDKEVSNNLIPPTKLKNNSVVSPFELLVNMYGIPNYKEIDPTFFLGLTYLVFFGAMFGDVGQGLIFVIFGFLMSKSKNSSYGKILLRLGLSSMAFGFLYGSFFGLEEIIPGWHLRPMENINYVLGASIGFGVCLLLIGFGLSMYNLKTENKYDELIFGKDGISGLIFYIALLILGIQAFLSKSLIPNAVLGIVCILSLAAILFRAPLWGLIKKADPNYGSGKSFYYIEGSFNLIETILSFLSNTISFIRVGAFAINHVGLFLAFATMAKMVNQPIAGIFILILGNVIIICLEGLIVFIQGLRLEYYELFNKYFKGDGREYIPVTYIR